MAAFNTGSITRVIRFIAEDGSTYLGVSFFMRYDQVIPIIRGTAYHFQSEGDPSLGLSSVTLETVSGQASMPRFQFGLRGRILF